jgi:hypothetical protein
MNREFVPYELALALKGLGFDEPCLGYYTTGNDVTLDKDGNKTNFVLLSAKLRGELVGHGYVRNSLFKWLKENDKTSGELYTLSNSVTAPLYQQAFRWFREKYDKYGVVNIDLSNNLEDKIFVYMIEDKLGYIIDRSEEYNTYEEAELACLEKLIEIVKENRQ